MKKSCNHRKAWIINGGYSLWCYECGAFRQTEPRMLENEQVIVPLGKRWIKPTGIGGKNPYDKLVERKK